MTDDPMQDHLTGPGPDEEPTQDGPALPPDQYPTQPFDGRVPPGEYPADDYPPEAYRPDYGPPPDRPPRKKRRRRRSPFWAKFWQVVKIGCGGLAIVLAAMLGAGIVAGIVLYNSLAAEISQDITKLDTMEGVEDFETSRIYDRSGEVLLYEVFNEGRRTEVTLDRIPLNLRYATIATEDDSFYENPGFDPPSIARAAYQWFQEGEIVSGASTITQQLVRQIVFDYEERTEVTLRRKLKEVALAWVMTQKYTKDEILELYLNEAYYGNLAYGIEEASNIYFDKPASELSLAEASFLAGLPQSPATYDPYNNFAVAKARQRQVLDLMVRHGYIDMAEADAAFNELPLSSSDFANPDILLEAPHFTTEVRRQLAELPGIEPEMIARGGLVVTTTLDMDMQELAEQIVADRIAEVGDEFNMHNAALVAVHPVTGEVLAMVGSVDYEDEDIDGAVNNTLSPHQPGSTMKPLTYAAAFEMGWTPADVIWDVPITYDTGIGEYEPVNYDGRFHGPVRLRDALANSYNIPAVELLNEIGVESLLEISQRFGIESLEMNPALYGLSLTLGGGEVTAVEMASAFGVFANGGYKISPHTIMRVEDNDGSVLYEAPPGPGEAVLDERIAFQINSILSDNVARTPAMGADSPLLLDFPAAVKTGTTNDYRDNWTVGYTPQLVVAVWSGNTNNEPMAEGVSGLTGAAPIWHDYMTGVYALPGIASVLETPGAPALRADFTAPQRVESRQVCVLSSLADPAPAEEGCPRQRGEWFLVGGLDPSISPTQVPTPTPIPTIQPQPGQDVPPGPAQAVREPFDTGIVKLAVLPLDEEQQAQVVEVMSETWDALPDEAPQPDPPLYCEVAQQDAAFSETAFQLFITAPEDPVYAVRARNWAMQNGVPIEPGVPCSQEIVAAEAEAVQGSYGAYYVLSEPKAGDEVYGVLPVIGTVRYDSQWVEFYKLEIGRGANPTEWLTLGNTHTEFIDNDIIEYLHADALEPGQYVLRLSLIMNDGNLLQPPFDVPLTVVSESPPDTEGG